MVQNDKKFEMLTVWLVNAFSYVEMIIGTKFDNLLVCIRSVCVK